MSETNNKDLIMEEQENIWNKAANSVLADGQIDQEEMQRLKNTLGELKFETQKNTKK